MAKARIDIIGDAGSFLRSVRLSRGETNEFRGDLTKLGVTVAKTATAQVKAAQVSANRLRSQIVAYRQLASAAKKGSTEQVAAANLAAQAEARLARSITLTDHEQRIANRNAGRFGRSVAAGARQGEGALARLRHAFGLGIGVAFGVGSIFEIKGIVKNATEAQAAAGQFRQASKDVGNASADTNRQLEDQLQTQRQLGFTNLESSRTMATLERATRNVTVARHAQLLVDNIARGRHLALATVANAVSRAYGGQTGALRRLVPFISKTATATQALQQADKAYAGSAVKYAGSAAGAQAKVTAAIDATEEAASQALLPTITQLSNSVSAYLSKASNQRKIQRDVATTFHDIGTVAHVVVGIIRAATPVVKTFNTALGGTENTIKLLAGTILVFKAVKLLDSLALISGGAGGAAGKVSLLRSRLIALRTLGAIGITIVVGVELTKEMQAFSKWLGSTGFGKAIGAGDTPLPKGVTFDDLVKAKRDLDAGKLTARDRKVLSEVAASQGKQLPPELSALSATKGLGPHSAAATAAAARAAAKPAATVAAAGGNLSAWQKNQLELATAKTDTQKLAALVDERRLLSGKIATVRRQLKTAKGAQADLLIADLQSLEQQDTDAWTQIHDIEQRAAAKKKAAISAAATAARKAASTYATAVATHARELANSAANASAIATTKQAYAKLIAYYKAEAHDEKLTAAQRAKYAGDAIAARKHLVQQIKAEKAAMDKATETKQLAALGLGKGSSIDQLITRIKDAATAKEQGLSTSGKLGTPTVSALRTEARQVADALKGTYLDTNLSRNVLSKIRTLLNGQLGKLNADMRGKIHQLLGALKGEITDFDGFNLTAAEKRRRFLDRRFADRYGGNHNRTKNTTFAATAPQYHWHFEPHIEAILDEPLGRALDRSFFKMRAALATGG